MIKDINDDSHIQKFFPPSSIMIVFTISFRFVTITTNKMML